MTNERSSGSSVPRNKKTLRVNFRGVKRPGTLECPERGNIIRGPWSNEQKKASDRPKPMGDDAYFGLTGRIVRTIAPETEASPELLIVSFLVAFGNWIGRSPYMKVEETRHYTNEFAVFVGDTSIGRKGTGWDRVRAIFDAAEAQGDDPWIDRIKSGLASGEGLIAQVKDEEKRLMIVEPEFARALIVINRDGNTLSAIIRSAWESGSLRTLTKMPVEATDAHISIVGHITLDELKRQLNRVEVANGFANRFLFVAVYRSRQLPFGGKHVDYKRFAVELQKARRFALRAGELDWTANAKELWAQEYSELTEGKPGLLGSVTNRAAPHVLRLAMLYAVLDASRLIRSTHLRAALEVWRYCEDSAQRIFSDTLGDDTADTILQELRKSDMGRAEISRLFSRNRSALEIERALTFLREKSLARFAMVGTSGRPKEVWSAI